MTVFVFELTAQNGFTSFETLQKKTLEEAEAELERRHAAENGTYQLYQVYSDAEYRERVMRARSHQVQLLIDMETQGSQFLSSKMQKLRAAGYAIMADYDKHTIFVYPTLDVQFKGQTS